ncbi:MAG TPA: class I SAM-dependent methyltransferase, partial [Nitrospiria bacterium]
MNGFEIDFEKSLEIGPRAYDKNVGEWWNERSEDPAHKQAYRNILSHIASLPLGEKPVIVDYGCGPGNILTRLSRLFPGSEIHGIDGSSRMLERTRNRLKALHGKLPRRIRLTRHHLPDFSIPSGFADLVIYAFPH